MPHVIHIRGILNSQLTIRSKGPWDMSPAALNQQAPLRPSLCVSVPCTLQITVPSLTLDVPVLLACIFKLLVRRWVFTLSKGMLRFLYPKEFLV